MNGEQQQPQQPERVPQFSFATATPVSDTTTATSSVRYMYKSRKLPAKPRVLDAGENLAASIDAGVDENVKA